MSAHSNACRFQKNWKIFSSVLVENVEAVSVRGALRSRAPWRYGELFTAWCATIPRHLSYLVSMRRLLLILIALSLSPVTTGFSCDVEGAALRSACCCDAGVPQRCSQPASHCTSSTMTGRLQHGGCCSVVVISSIAAQDQPQAPPTIQMPVLVVGTLRALARFQDVPSAPIRLSTLGRGHPPTYLLTGRLRR
jgi:hypothetical protein